MSIPVATLGPGSQILVVVQSLIAATSCSIEVVTAVTDTTVTTDQRTWEIEEDRCGDRFIHSRYVGRQPFGFMFSTAHPLPATQAGPGGSPLPALGPDAPESGRAAALSATHDPDIRDQARRSLAAAAERLDDPELVRLAVNALSTWLAELQVVGDCRAG